jgi:hypothetical protein
MAETTAIEWTDATWNPIVGCSVVSPGCMRLHYGRTPDFSPRYAFAEKGVEFAAFDDDALTFRVGKKAAGRLLDGVEHNAMPEAGVVNRTRFLDLNRREDDEIRSHESPDEKRSIYGGY